MSIDIFERKFRETPKSHKKHVKYLIVYINHLLDKERIIEAKFYFHKLQEVKPKYLKTIVLGYELAIKTFNNEDVLKYDKSLVKSSYKKELLFNLRIKYYYSVNDKKNFETVVVDCLRNIKLSDKSLNLIVPLIVNSDSFQSISVLIEYLKVNKKQLTNSAEIKVRKVVLQELVNKICKV